MLTKISTSFDFSRHNYTMITDRRKCTTKLSLYRRSSFRFYR